MSRAALALLMAIWSSAASAQTGMVWQSYHGSPSPGRAGVELFYGVPRSGDLLISGSCDISGPTPQIQLTLYTGDLPFPPGATVTVDVVSPGRPQISFPARNEGFDDFSGLTLVQADLPLQSGLWDVFAAPAPLSYAVRGAPPITIQGEALPVRDFLEVCAARGGPQCGAAAPSVDSGVPLRLTVTNSARGARGITWLSPEGELTQIGRLEPGQSGTLDTDAGHIWMFTDDQGRCVEMRAAGQNRAGIELFKPGPN